MGREIVERARIDHKVQPIVFGDHPDERRKQTMPFVLSVAHAWPISWPITRAHDESSKVYLKGNQFQEISVELPVDHDMPAVSVQNGKFDQLSIDQISHIAA